MRINKKGQTKRLLMLLNENPCCPPCPKLSGDEGNVLECRENGLYSPGGGGGEVTINAPLYFDENNAITINQVSNDNDGYLSSEDYTFLMNSALWEIDVNGRVTTIDNPIDVGLRRSLMINSNPLHTTTTTRTAIYENVGGTLRAYIAICGSSHQSVAIGSRGLADRIATNNWHPTTNIGESVAVGEYAGGSMTTGEYNVLIGKAAGYTLTTGSRNLIVGSNVTVFSTGSGNTILGSRGPSSITSGTGNDNILIGSNVPPPVDYNTNSQLNIGNWIYGIAGAIGIGVTNPVERLEVNGNIKTATFGAGNGAWKLGKLVTAASVLDATRYIEVQVDGVTYKLALAV